MRQFFIYTFVGASIAILELIDSAFANNISIDSICVMSAFAIVYWCINIFCKAGEYAYNIKLKYETECFILNIISTAICSILMILLRNQIPHLYKLTDRQYELFSICIFWKAVFLIFSKIESYFRTYIEITCQNKHIVISNIIFYVSMIALDALVIINHGECYHLIITTGLADVITVIYYIIFCRFKFKRPSIKILKECIMSAKDILIDRVLGKVATVVFNICASYLGTELYALHSVGYGIATNVEEVTNCCYTYQVVRLKAIENVKDKYEESKKIAKKIFIPTVLISYVVAAIMVVPMKGSLNLLDALFITALYNSQSILIQLYENHRGYLTSCAATKCLRLGGLFGIISRIPIAIISILTPINIYGFALGSGLDFLVRGIYYWNESKKIANNGNRELLTE